MPLFCLQIRKVLQQPQQPRQPPPDRMEPPWPQQQLLLADRAAPLQPPQLRRPHLVRHKNGSQGDTELRNLLGDTLARILLPCSQVCMVNAGNGGAAAAAAAAAAGGNGAAAAAAAATATRQLGNGKTPY